MTHRAALTPPRPALVALVALAMMAVNAQNCPGIFKDNNNEAAAFPVTRVGLSTAPKPWLWGLSIGSTSPTEPQEESVPVVNLVIGSTGPDPTQYDIEYNGRVVEYPVARAALPEDERLDPPMEAVAELLSAPGESTSGFSPVVFTDDDTNQYYNEYDRSFWNGDERELLVETPFLSSEFGGTGPDDRAGLLLNAVEDDTVGRCRLDTTSSASVSTDGPLCPTWNAVVGSPTTGTVLPGLGTVTGDGRIIAAWFAKQNNERDVQLMVIAVVEIDDEVKTIMKYSSDHPITPTDRPWVEVLGAMPRELETSGDVYVPDAISAVAQDGYVQLVRIPSPGSASCWEVLVLYLLEDDEGGVSLEGHPAHSLGEVLWGNGWVADKDSGFAYYLYGPEAGMTAGFVSWGHRNETGYAPVVSQVSWDLKELGVETPPLRKAYAYWVSGVATIGAILFFGSTFRMPKDEEVTKDSGAGGEGKPPLTPPAYTSATGLVESPMAMQGMPMMQQQHSMPMMIQQVQPMQGMQGVPMMQQQHSMPAMMIQQQQQPMQGMQQQQGMQQMQGMPMMQQQHSMPMMIQQVQQHNPMQQQHSMPAMMIQQQQPPMQGVQGMSPQVPAPPMSPSGGAGGYHEQFVHPDANNPYQ